MEFCKWGYPLRFSCKISFYYFLRGCWRCFEKISQFCIPTRQFSCVLWESKQDGNYFSFFKLPPLLFENVKFLSQNTDTFHSIWAVNYKRYRVLQKNDPFEYSLLLCAFFREKSTLFSIIVCLLKFNSQYEQFSIVRSFFAQLQRLITTVKSVLFHDCFYFDAMSAKM